MTIIGNSNTGVTLSPQNPNVTITGAITGTAPITVNGTAGSYSIPAAVQGGPGATFDITNLGNIQGGGGAGIVLSQPGILSNSGVVDGAIGLFMSGYSAGAYVHNTGLIDGFASLGTGIGISGPAGVNNSGSVLAGKYAVFLYRGGDLTNTGLIKGGLEGAYLFDGGQIRNQGTIIGAGYAGLNVTQVSGNTTSLYNAASGRIAGDLYGVLLQGATTPETITNTGYIGAVDRRYGTPGTLGTRIQGARYDGIYLESGLVTNTGTITAFADPLYNATGIFAAAGPATIINKGLIAGNGEAPDAINLYAGGAIINQGTLAGRVNCGAAATIANAGLITGIISSFDAAALTLNNQKTGTISTGVVIAQGVIDNAGLIKLGIAGGGGPITINNSGIIANDANTGDATYDIIVQNGTARITNTGTISGFTEAIDLITAGTIINRGVIKNLDTTALGHAIELGAGSTLYNAGIIASADSTSVGFGRFGATKNLLILAPTSTITGIAAVNGGVELTAGAGTLNLSGIAGLTALHFDSGAHWQLIGALNPTVAIYNSSTLTNPAGPGLTLAAPVYNYGLISGASVGVISAGNYLYNSGQIAGQTTGINLTAPAYVINTGTVSGQSGVALAANSQFYNYTGASIAGGLTATTNTALYNYARATITAQNTAISLTSGHAYNAGLLSAASGIVLSTGTVTNLGTIAATAYAIDFTTSTAANRLILSPTAITTGAINLGGGTLDLTALAHKTGTLASALAGAGAISLAARANWDFAAPLTTPTLTNNGTILDRAGLTITNTLTGFGTIVLDSSLTIGAATSQRLAFAAPAETLTLTDPSAFAAAIHNFTPGDTIALPTIAPGSITAETFAKNILTLTEATGRLTFTFASIPTHDTFSLIADGAGTGIILASPAAPNFATPTPAETTLPALPAYPAPAAAKPYLATATQSGFLALTQTPTAALIPALTLQS